MLAKVVRWPLNAGLEKLVHHRLVSLVLRLDRCVQAAEVRDGPIDQVPHAVLVADVCAEEFDFSASARSSVARSWPASSWRPATTVRWPSRAKARAAARPIPVSAPVIKTTGVPISPLLPIRLAWGPPDEDVHTLPMLEARFWERDPRILCRLVPYLGGMGHVME